MNPHELITAAVLGLIFGFVIVIWWRQK